MVMRQCLGCGRLTAGSRCTACTTEFNRPRYAAKDAKRGTGRQRYGPHHDAVRAKLLPKAIGQPCPRCGELMLPGQELDAGHSVARSVDPSARADRIEHSRCNRSAGAA